jgi:tRNA threonylcarbamoyladenosine biosynthesis protein TsaB
MILGIDSSDNFVSLGIVSNSTPARIIIAKSRPVDIRRKVLIHNFLNEILDDSKLGIEAMTGISVTIGPGSFTGLRVGMAIAKGICWTLGLPLAGVSSLRAIAESTMGMIPKLMVIKDARRNEFYYGGYDFSDGQLIQSICDSVGSPSNLIELIKTGYIPVGPGLDAFNALNLIQAYENPGCYSTDNIGAAVALMGQIKILKHETLEIATSEPNYVRIPKPGKAV